MGRNNVVDINQAGGVQSTKLTHGGKGKAQRNNKRVHLVLLDPRPLTRQALLNFFIALIPEWRVTPASTLAELQNLRLPARTPQPDLIVLSAGRLDVDLFGKDIASIRERFPGASVVVLVDSEEAETVTSALRLGANGFITTALDPPVIVRALFLVVAGGTFMPSSAIKAICEEKHHRHSRRSLPTAELQDGCVAGEEQTVGLTARQKEVFQLLRLGLPNKIIAYKLGMKECSVKAHVRQLMRKLGAKNRTQVACYAGMVSDGNPRANPAGGG